MFTASTTPPGRLPTGPTGQENKVEGKLTVADPRVCCPFSTLDTEHSEGRNTNNHSHSENDETLNGNATDSTEESNKGLNKVYEGKGGFYSLPDAKNEKVRKADKTGK